MTVGLRARVTIRVHRVSAQWARWASAHDELGSACGETDHLRNGDADSRRRALSTFLHQLFEQNRDARCGLVIGTEADATRHPCGLDGLLEIGRGPVVGSWRKI